MVIAATIGSLSAAAPASEPSGAIDISQSAVTVHVFKTGLFRTFGDNHDIRGTVKSGFIKTTAPIQANLVVDAADLRVLDADASVNDREQIRVRMLGPEVLDAGRFRDIRFESTSAERTESGAWIVRGALTLHGQTHALVTLITEDQGHYKGAMTLRQTDYGITPISVAGGVVKVKDELKIDFDIVTKGTTTH